MVYIGSPNDGKKQMRNPMVRADGEPHQPFVAVLNIGVGNCNALYDGNGRIVAYFDFGFPNTPHHATAPLLQYAHCIHDDPLMVLSHWDWDHYSMARRVRQAWNLRWVAPRQHIGSVATREVYARIVNSPDGGELHLWPAAAAGMAAAEHLRLPWGYLERGLAHHQLANNKHPKQDGEMLNNGGLSAYVCVRDVPAATLLSIGALAGTTGVELALAVAIADTAVVANAAAVAGAPPWLPPVPANLLAAAQTAAQAVANRPAVLVLAATPVAVANAVTAMSLQTQADEIAAAADRAVTQYALGLGGAAPAAADIARATAAAIGGLASLTVAGGGWHHALVAMGAAGAAGGAVCNIAAAVDGWLMAAGGATAAAAAIAGAGAYGALGLAPQRVSMAAAIADAAVASDTLARAALPPWLAVGNILVAAQGAAAAVNGAAGGGGAVALAPVNGAVAAAATALRLQAQADEVAAAASRAVAQIPELGNVAAAAIATATAASVCELSARAGVGTWNHAMTRMHAVGFTGGAVTNAANPLDGVLNGPGGATAAAAVDAVITAIVPAGAAAAAPVAARAGLPPPSVDARRAATNAANAAAALYLGAQVDTVARAAEQTNAAYAGLAGAAVASADIVRAAAVAVGELTARAGGGTWIHALAAMSVAGAFGGVVTIAALAMNVPVGGAGGATCAGAIPAGLGGAVALHAAHAAAIADAAEAAVNLALAGPPAGWPAATVPNAADAAVQAVHALAGPVPPGAMPLASANIIAAIGEARIDAQLWAVAAGAAAGAAEAAIHAGAALALAPAAVVRASAVAVGVTVARAGIGIWGNVVAVMIALGGAGGAVCNSPVTGALGAAVTAAASANANALAVGLAVPAPANVEAAAAAAAVADAAIEAYRSKTAMIAAGPPVNLAAERAGAGATATLAVAQWHAGNVAAPATTKAAASQRSAALGSSVQEREVAAAAHAAAREIVIATGAAGAANMHAAAAPLPDAPGAKKVLVAPLVAPGAPGAKAVGLAGATPLAGLIPGVGYRANAERYVFLTGDAGVGYIPSTGAGAAGPRVVGLVATHHGANTCFPNGTVDKARIPYAPGSAAAAAAATAHLVRLAGGNVAVQRVAAAAAFAVAELAIRNNDEPVTNHIALHSIAAAAIAMAGAGTWQANLTAMQGIAAGFSAIPMVAAAAGMPQPAVATAVAALGVAGTGFSALIAASVAQVAAAVIPAAGFGGAMNAAAAVATAVPLAPGGATVPALGAGAPAFVGVYAASVTAAANAAVVAAGVPMGNQVAVSGAIQLAVGAIGVTVAWRRAVYAAAAAVALADAEEIIAAGGPDPSHDAATAARAAMRAFAADVQLLGPFLAAVAPAAALAFWPGAAGAAGLKKLSVYPAGAVEGAVEADAAGKAAAAAIAGANALNAVSMPRSGRVVYSYGVRDQAGNYVHYYTHPHPKAVATYAARGWIERRNTSVNAWHSKMPDPWLPLGGPAFYAGDNSALGWEYDPAAGYEGPLRGDGGAGQLIDRNACTLCGPFHCVC
jgi:hypothetical protein